MGVSMGETNEVVTVPADDLPGLREFAREWLGLDPWALAIRSWGGAGGGQATGLRPAHPAWWADEDRIIPLHAQAGRSLGIAYYSDRAGIEQAARLLLVENLTECAVCGGTTYEPGVVGEGKCLACSGTGKSLVLPLLALRARLLALAP